MCANARVVIGRAIRLLREASGLTQERLAERAHITYQYLSAVENGKENFSIAVLESIAFALDLDVPTLVERSYADSVVIPLVNPNFLIREAPLPPGLTLDHVQSALNETQRVIQLVNSTLQRVTGRPLPAYIQANSFSGIVSNILCDSFSRLTPYKHNHAQRYPDLVYIPDEPSSPIGLEVKSTTRLGKGGESHNGHSGWHVVACFALDSESGDIRFVHVMFADLIGYGKPNADWKYLGSRINTRTGSQRTETYITTPVGTAKLRHGTVYLDKDNVNIRRWRTVSDVPAPPYSPFAPSASRPQSSETTVQARRRTGPNRPETSWPGKM